MRRSIELRQNRAKLIEDAGAILTQAHNAGRDLTSEEEARWTQLHADADAQLKQIERIELQEQRERELAESRLEERRGDRRATEDDDQDETPEQRAEAEMQAFRSWLRWGREGLSDVEQRHTRILSGREMREAIEALPPEVRAQTVTTTGGGYLIPVGFQAELDQAMLAFGGMRQAARVIQTASGNTLDWPTVNDTANKGRLLAINTQATTTDVAYGQVQFGAYKFSSDAVLVPVELAQDSAFDMDSHLRDLLSERLGRITNQYMTTGTGTAQPNGIVTAAVDSAINISIGGGLTYANMVDIEHSVDPAYRALPGTGWMFHDDFLALVKKLLDSNGRPIFRPATEAPGNVDTVLGYPVFINQDVPDPGTATNKAVLFGNFKKYIFRVVRPMVLLRLVERYADYHQIGFLAFERADGDLIDAGTNPVKFADMVA